MALKKCKECSKKISDEVLSCPNCGISKPFEKNRVNIKTKKRTKKIIFTTVFLICFIPLGVFFYYSMFLKQEIVSTRHLYDRASISDEDSYKLTYKKPIIKREPIYNIAKIENVKSRFLALSKDRLGGLKYEVKYILKNKTKKAILVDVKHSYLGRKKYNNLKNYYTEHDSDNSQIYNVSSNYYLGDYPYNKTNYHKLNPLEEKEFTAYGSVNFTTSTIEYDYDREVKIKRSGKEKAYGLLLSMAVNRNVMGSEYETVSKYDIKAEDKSIKESYISLKRKIENKFDANLLQYTVDDNFIKNEFLNTLSLDNKYIIIGKILPQQKKLKIYLIEKLLSDATKEEDIERFVSFEKEFRENYINITTKSVNDHYKIYEKINTIEGYKFFIKHFSNYDIATVAIFDMHEKGYKLARDVNTKEGYDSYLSLFPYSNRNNEVSILANELEKKEIEEDLDPHWLNSIFTGEEDKRNKREVLARRLYVSAKRSEKNENIHIANRKYFIIMNSFNDTEAAYRVIDDDERKVSSKLEQERFNVISEKLVGISSEIKSQTSNLASKFDATISVLKDNRKAIIDAMSNNSAYITERIDLNRDILTNQLTHMNLMKEQTQYLHNAKEEQDNLRAKRLEKVLKNR